ncbi:MAG: membrane protein [Nitrospirales bacterium]|nr:MAG: membrane protein [Nitrospirales bacterium]
MIPQLTEKEALSPVVLAFVDALTRSAFTGDVETHYGGRLSAATDNSIYQVTPQAVLFPRSQADVQCILQLATHDAFANVTFTARGGGTGTNGQSLTEGVVIDLSRHMNRIVEVNEAEGWAWVEPGVVLDQLNAHVKPHGVFFAPELAPSNRATIGGMVSTDASGKGSRLYGKTSNHVLALDVVFSDGSAWQSVPLDATALQELKSGDDLVNQIYQGVDRIVTSKKELIEERFPKLTRFLTGYNLAHVYTEDGHFNLHALLAGSEGTLAVVTGIKVTLTPLPTVKRLIVAKYVSFDDCLRAATILVQADPAAIETVDDTIVALARQDVVWDRVGKFFSQPGDDRVKSINLIEFAGNDADVVNADTQALCDQLDALLGQEHEAVGYQLATTDADIVALWELRAKGVGLLGNTKGNRRPIPFVEDTVVPPEHLADYIQEFRQVLDAYGLEYGMFGHVDVGCLHVRPALDLKEKADEKLIRMITDQVKDLVLKYGGVVWGEHGKGLRGEYMPEFFGPELYDDLRCIKQLFDPTNKLNPGKLVTPIDHPAGVKTLDSVPLRGHLDRQIPEAVREEFHVSIHCNGNGACFNFDLDDVMCPSYKFTRDRIHSPKGRAGMMREWLRQLSHTRYDLQAKDESRGHLAIPEATDSDFSLEVYEAMDGCLSCKACTSMCPIKVDIPDLKAKFLNRFYTRYQRPLKDKLIAFGERTHHRLLAAPLLYNAGVKLPFFEPLMRDWVGLVDTPQLSSPTYTALLDKAGIHVLHQIEPASLQHRDLSKTVFILPDAITAFYEAETFVDCVALFKKIGFEPIVTPFIENGKGQHVKGFLQDFQHTARQATLQLEKLASMGRPIIGIDPAMTLTYQEEYRTYLDRPGVVVWLPQEWLANELPHLAASLTQLTSPTIAFMGHCGEKTSIQASGRQWQTVFKAFGLDLEIVKAGCCGMAGAFGHETAHYDESKGIYEQSWKLKLADSHRPIVATGASCRSQVRRFEGSKIAHPLQFLSRLLG